MTAIECIRLVGTEFADVSDATMESWIEFVAPMVSKKQFGNLYNQALALLVCHYLAVANVRTDDSDSTGGGDYSQVWVGGASYGLESISDGTTSISFDNNFANATQKDAEYALTRYGMQYLQLRRLVVVPIHTSGELHV